MRVHGEVKFYGDRCTEQPLCRYCARPIQKSTATIYCYAAESEQKMTSQGSKMAMVFGTLRTKADCERVTNYRVVSMRKWNDEITSFNVWDGETYYDQHFCTLKCAANLGRIAASPSGGGLATVKWQRAVEVRNAKERAA